MTSPDPVLVACAHGTRDPHGRKAVGALVAAVRDARPGLDVRAAFVDVHPPDVGQVVAEVAGAGGRAVVVPLLLSAGYHVAVDVAAAFERRDAVAAPALGPDARVTAGLLDRLRDTRLADVDAVVVAAAGSSDPAAVADVEAVLRDVAPPDAVPVAVAYGASASPSVPDAVAGLRAQRPGTRVAVAAYLLAPGHFHTRLQRAGADVVAQPLLGAGRPDPRLVEVVLDRYDAARG
ncbi:hypothetical protein GCM10027446_21560 [Angustibacter peucedani]